MIKIGDKEVFSSLEELLNPDYTALVVIDVQNDFVSKGGLLEKWGDDISVYVPTIKNIRRILALARELKLKIFHIMNACEPRFGADSPAWIRYKLKRGGAQNIGDLNKIPNPYEYDAVIRGSWGAQITKELSPEKNEFVVEKTKSSAFVDTNFDSLLRANSIKSLVLTGIVTHGCVESTARDSMFHDYYTTVINDGVNSYSKELHEASLKVMATRVDIIDTSTLVDVWNRFKKR